MTAREAATQYVHRAFPPASAQHRARTRGKRKKETTALARRCVKRKVHRPRKVRSWDIRKAGWHVEPRNEH